MDEPCWCMHATGAPPRPHAPGSLSSRCVSCERRRWQAARQREANRTRGSDRTRQPTRWLHLYDPARQLRRLACRHGVLDGRSDSICRAGRGLRAKWVRVMLVFACDARVGGPEFDPATAAFQGGRSGCQASCGPPVGHKGARQPSGTHPYFPSTLCSPPDCWPPPAETLNCDLLRPETGGSSASPSG